MLSELIAARPTNRAALPNWYLSLFIAQEEEGLTIADLASVSGISAANLYLRRRQLRHPERQGRVRVTVPHADTVREPRAASGFELRLSASRTLTIPVGFDADELQRQLRALSSC